MSLWLKGFLFHRYALGKVPRAVNVFALTDCDMVGQQLEGYAGDEWLEALERVGKGDDVVGKPLYLRVALSDERRDSSASRPDLLYVRDDLLVESVACGNDEDGHFAVDEGDGAVLHLGSRIAFGMDVGDFLQLQCAFQSQGIVVAAP